MKKFEIIIGSIFGQPITHIVWVPVQVKSTYKK